ncbi:hypothetical protein LTS10_006308 [Elasticomyces elasticus]|nr:hypothetical protein LTS10_006308 [Elasticomyces elasticus]
MPDARQGYIQKWVTHANRDCTVEKSQVRSFKTMVDMLAGTHSKSLDTNDPDRAVLQLDKGKMTVGEFKPVKSRKRKTSSSESGFISKEVQSKELMSVKDMKKAGRFDMLAKHPDTVTANNDDDDGEVRASDEKEPSQPLGQDSGCCEFLVTAQKAGGATGSPNLFTKADGRDRTSGNLLALGKMTDLPRNAEPQIDDQQAIRIIRDRGVKKMLRNASGGRLTL